MSYDSTTILHPTIYADQGIGVDWQVFMIKNEENNELISKNGNSIFIKAHTFNTYQSKIKLKEVLDKSAAVREGLNTIQDNGTVLESGGMIYLNAYDKDRNEQEPNKAIPFYMNTAPSYMYVYNTSRAGNEES